MSSKIPRYSLYNFFRLSFFLNGFVSLLLVVLIFYHRSRIKTLESAVTVLTAYNSTLNHDLNKSINYITNEYFTAASSFASNVLHSASFSLSPAAFPSSVASSLIATNGISSSVPELPSFTFSGYFENNGVPYICLRHKYYKPGDILLGYPITAISPDVVEYRDKFYKVVESAK